MVARHFWWDVQVLIVKLYVLYKKVLKQAVLTPVSHYQYQQAITSGLIDLEKHGVAGKKDT